MIPYFIDPSKISLSLISVYRDIKRQTKQENRFSKYNNFEPTFTFVSKLSRDKIRLIVSDGESATKVFFGEDLTGDSPRVTVAESKLRCFNGLLFGVAVVSPPPVFNGWFLRTRLDIILAMLGSIETPCLLLLNLFNNWF